ncbi:Glutamine-dependent NAD(+) synthetase [Candidatus Arsenophonus lipoptenae]|uniref:Glutamine-dependent NAD(+) synthetase n=1 Tax=Candidatus Arsenophonus lipoptenae TaxID=634113 RepID=A0A0X9VVP5_9GAMM|nr:NAD+ synthase [Candidatus Arsenophonus lipoptenae]AMA65058.1 Glutamine-dependent NAD(+) synthetase [Candidatus Arsenophonus lipoptenae]
MNRKINIALAQLNWLVGDIEGNCERMLREIKNQKLQGADLILFSELSLTGYPPEDLIFRRDFNQNCNKQLNRLKVASQNIAIVVGHIWKKNKKYYNSLSFFWQKKIIARYFKQKLPNYGVFDEKRYFYPGHETCVLSFKNYKLGFLICEDIWSNELVDIIKSKNADIIITINASPYNHKKPYLRTKLLKSHIQRINLPIIYLNQVGGQDELIFDGGSKVLNSHGEITHNLTQFSEQVIQCKFNDSEPIPMTKLTKNLSPIAQVYEALVMSTRDYIKKNRFPGVIIGLSGGIDSALTLAIATDAIGKDKVQAIMMPFKYTTQISIHDAREEAKLLDIEFTVISIERIYYTFISELSELFTNKTPDNTEENLQARCRAIILMAISNKSGRLVLTTSNKSELAIGYTTIYGDMAGGFAVLKDIPKMLVFQLARYRNKISSIIPSRVINRQPTSELTPGKIDLDNLPPYPVLDAILEGYVEKDKSINQLVKSGFDEMLVRRIINLVNINEYKRRQAPVGPKITIRNFNKDRRYPITSAFNHNYCY